MMLSREDEWIIFVKSALDWNKSEILQLGCILVTGSRASPCGNLQTEPKQTKAKHWTSTELSCFLPNFDNLRPDN